MKKGWAVVRDWKLFWRYAFKSLKYSAIGVSLVPVFGYFMNPDIHSPGYLHNLFGNLRIGIEISALVFTMMTGVYGFLYWREPRWLYAWKSSVWIQSCLGVALM